MNDQKSCNSISMSFSAASVVENTSSSRTSVALNLSIRFSLRMAAGAFSIKHSAGAWQNDQIQIE
jgi:hypothetical protein